MSLYRVGEIWYVDVTPANSGRVRRSTGTADRKAAQEYHDTLKADFWRQAKLGDTPSSTWGEAAAAWLKESERDASDRYRLKALELPLTLPLAELTAARIESELKGMTPGSHNRCANLIAAVLNLAKEKGLTKEVPAIARRPTPKGRVRWLTADEWKKLRKRLPAYLEQMAAFTLATGLRENNVLNLEWRQVDLRRRVAWIHADQAKAGRSIGVPLNDDAMAILEARKGTHRTWVFAHEESGKPIVKASNRAWRAARKAAGLQDVRWHDLRHTWASWHVMGGTTIIELMELGGWASMAMVQRYAHLAPEHLARAAANVKPVSLRHTRGTKKHA